MRSRDVQEAAMSSDDIRLGYMSIARGEWHDGHYSDSDDDEGDGDMHQRERIAADEVVINEREITIVFTYPLSGDFSFAFKSASEAGFTRKELSELIMQTYHKIYDEEEQTSSVTAGHIAGMLNRNQTSGKYGIWGHDICDLMLHSMQKTRGKYYLGVDS